MEDIDVVKIYGIHFDDDFFLHACVCLILITPGEGWGSAVDCITKRTSGGVYILTHPPPIARSLGPWPFCNGRSSCWQ